MVSSSTKYEPLICHAAATTSRWWSKDSIAIVTGANKGIGYALVKRFAELGLTVVLTSRDQSRGFKAMDSLKDLGLNRNVHFFQLDISDPVSICSFVSWFESKFDAFDILVFPITSNLPYKGECQSYGRLYCLNRVCGNEAGSPRKNPTCVNNAAVCFNVINENSIDHAETTINTNYYGSKHFTEAMLPFFRRSPSMSRILNISSRLGTLDKLKNAQMKEILGDKERLSEDRIEKMVSKFLQDVKEGRWTTQGWPEIWTDYAVSKLALNSYSQVLARRLEGVTSVNCFSPRFTQTSMTDGKGKHSADDAAKMAATISLLPTNLLTTGKFYSGSTTRGICSKL